MVRQKTERVDTTGSKVCIGNFNVKERKTVEHIILQIFGKTRIPLSGLLLFAKNPLTDIGVISFIRNQPLLKFYL